jgi:hypothetical protein
MSYCRPMSIKLWQVGVLAYGVLYFVLACAMEVENVNQSYPLAYVALSMIGQTLVVGGIFLFGLEASADFAKLWRWLFPLLVLELAAGIVFDATIPPDLRGAELISSELFGLWLAAPAYYFNFRVARYRG